MIEVSLEGSEFITLCDLLKRIGFCENGGHAKRVIGEGEVQVDGKVELKKRCKIIPGQVVQFEENKAKVIR